MAAQPSVAELGHVGLRCADLAAQVRFYTELVGLTITDHDEALGVWFLSARPDVEHHELLLAAGRDVPFGASLIQQVSFRCTTLEDVVGFLDRFRAADVPIDMVVSHGNAVGVYFFDPEGNRCEVYWQTGLSARQPFVENIDLNQSIGEILRQIRESVTRYGAEGFTESAYATRTRRQSASHIDSVDQGST